MSLEIPADWTIRGSLPAFDPAAKPLSPSQVLGLTEDLWRVTSPDETLVIDVGWYPQRDASGAFRGMVVVDQDWENPAEEIETTSLAEVRKWTDQAVQLGRTLRGGASH